MSKDKRININKEDISKEIYLNFGIPSFYAKKILNDVIKLLIQGLRRDKKLKINGFGSFKIIKKKKRIGRNPKTRELHEISERNTVSFKPANILKNKINNE